MDFGEQIKNVRIERKLTQEQMSQELNVSRQAVSNWENNRNLPDIEMLITMANVFHISLDQLILGGNDMNNMTEKLIRDGSENKKRKINMVSFCIGTALLLFGLICFVVRGPVNMDSDGVLHESLFTPISFLFFFCGFITFLITGFRNLICLFFDEDAKERKSRMPFIAGSIGVVLILMCGIFVLIESNSGTDTLSLNGIVWVCGLLGLLLLVYGIAIFIVSSIKRRKS